jgi:hypothetical protein
MDTQTNNLSNDFFSSIEKAFDAKVPAELINFINQYKDQKVDKKFNRKINDNFSQAMQLWSVMNPEQIKEAYDNLTPDPDIEQLKLFPFGETLGSPTICMSLHADAYGSIYVHDYDFGATKVADSLKDFLNMLKE